MTNSPSDSRQSSYREIFRSSAIIGATQVITTLLGVARNKIIALTVGSAGLGLLGMYVSITGLVGAVSGLGLNNSGVRHIAEAAGQGKGEEIAKAALVLRRITLVLGLIATLFVATLAVPISRLVFRSHEYATGVLIISLILLFDGVANSQKALLQGLRHLRQLAICQIIGAVCGTLASGILIWIFRRQGIPPFLLAVSLAGVLTSTWYSRQLRLAYPRLSWRETLSGARGLLSLGSAFMISSLLMVGIDFVIKAAILRSVGVQALGLYQATWTLSNVYVTVILSAMGADFYPRLTALAQDDPAANRLVNEQMEMGLLLSVPGIIGTLTFAPWILSVFYTAEFAPAATVIRWQILGIALRVISWPPAFIQLAKGRARVFIITESAFCLAQLGLTFGGLRLWGLEGVGAAFAFAYLFYSVVSYLVGRWLSGFRLSTASAKLLALSGSLVGATWLGVRASSMLLSLVVGTLLTIVSLVTSLVFLRRLLGVDPITLVRQRLGRIRS